MLAFGTRPEAIKMAPVYLALRAQKSAFETLCCVTAQHRGMLDQMLRTFEIVPEIDLDLMRSGQDLTDVNAGVLLAMRPVLADLRPDLILVHGDTTTTMASALAAFYAGIPVGHVEAGLRSADMTAPFPEELNRRVTSMVARYHFAPTETNRDNLLAEGCDPGAVIVTGNTVVDAMTRILARIDSKPSLRRAVEVRLNENLAFDWRKARFVLVTCHRRETISSGGMQRICSALRALAGSFPETHFVYPLHANPVIRETVGRELAGFDNVHLVEPLPYDVFLYVLRSCHCALTDSGGLQEEGPVLHKPVLVMRNVTERPEAVAAGGVRLVGTEPAGVIAAMSALLNDARTYSAMSAAVNPYGDGSAAQRIAAFLATQGRPMPDGAPTLFSSASAR